jgi:hypothetical protein
MINELGKIREEIRTVSKRVSILKNKNYSNLYADDDLRYIEELQRNLTISSAVAGTFIDHLSKQNGSSRLKVKIDVEEQNKEQE